jgi:hypothetical protein
MDFSIIEYGIIWAGIFLLIKILLSDNNKKRIRMFWSGEPDFFPTSPEFSMPAPLLNEIPEIVEVLRSKLNNGESVHRMLFGVLGNGPAALVATDKRVFRIYRKNLTFAFVQTHFFAINYCDISNIIQLESNMVFSSVKIKPKNGEDIVIDKIFESKHIDPFIIFVTNSIRLEKSDESPELNTDQMLRIGKNGEDLGEMPIKKVKKLIDSGHLSRKDLYWDNQSSQWIPLSCSDLIA